MNYGELFKRIQQISQKANQSKLSVFFDIVHCARKYGAGYMDYDVLEFWNKTPDQRETYLTRVINTNLVKKLNQREYWHYLDNKSEFNVRYAKYVNRRWIAPVKDNEEAIIEWLKSRDVIIAKPENLCSGQGILKINVAEYREVGKEKELYQYLLDNNISLLEEVVVQAKEMSDIYPGCVNTIRVVTIIDNSGIPQILAAAMKIGSGGAYVDNFNNGGLLVKVDINKGRTMDVPAVNIDGKEFKVHPETGAKISDIPVPRWNEIVETCKEAALVTPEVRYVGWDVAITPNGVTLIEGNQIPGYDLYQMPQHTPDKVGILKRFKEILGDELEVNAQVSTSNKSVRFVRKKV